MPPHVPRSWDLCLALDVQHYLAFELVLGLINTGSEPRTEDFTVQVTVGSGEEGPLPGETFIELAVRESE